MDLKQTLWRLQVLCMEPGNTMTCSWRCLWLGGGSCDMSRDTGRQEGPKPKSEVVVFNNSGFDIS